MKKIQSMAGKIFLPGIASALLILYFSSCRHEPSLSADTPTVCFQGEVYPIIKSNCAISGCHSASSHGEGPVLAAYDNIRNYVVPFKPNKSDLYNAITRKAGFEESMPPASRQPLTQEQIDKISIWILQGAENNTCPEPPCDTAVVTYSGSIQPLLNTWCVGCHGGNNPQSGLNFETYNGVYPIANAGILFDVVSHAPGVVPMPFESDKLPDCDIAMIRIWVEEGAPNN